MRTKHGIKYAMLLFWRSKINFQTINIYLRLIVTTPSASVHVPVCVVSLKGPDALQWNTADPSVFNSTVQLIVKGAPLSLVASVNE